MIGQQIQKSSNDDAKKSGKAHMSSMLKGKAAVTTVAGVAGAVVGAGVAVAATQILSDKQAREKVKETFNKVKTQVMDSIHEEQKRLKSSGNQKKLDSANSKDKDSGQQASKSPDRQTGPQISV